MRTRILCRESDRISCVDYCAGSAHWVPLEPVNICWLKPLCMKCNIPQPAYPKTRGRYVIHRVIWCVIKCSSSTRPYNIVLTGNIVSNDQTVFLNSWNIRFHEAMMWKLLQVWDCRTKKLSTPNNVLGKQINRDTLAQRRDQVPEPGYCASVIKN